MQTKRKIQRNRAKASVSKVNTHTHNSYLLTVNCVFLFSFEFKRPEYELEYASKHGSVLETIAIFCCHLLHLILPKNKHTHTRYSKTFNASFANTLPAKHSPCKECRMKVLAAMKRTSMSFQCSLSDQMLQC